MNIIQALDDPQVFGPFFRGPTWVVWRVFLAVLFGLPLTPEQLALYTKHTGRTMAPTSPLHEAWLVCGRRAGKIFHPRVHRDVPGSFKDWRPFLAPGEVGTIMIIAADRRQARVIMRYCLGLLKSVPMLAQLIEAETRESVTLRNRIVIEVHTASHRATSGYAILCALSGRDAHTAHRRGQRRARRRDHQRHQAGHGHHPRRDAAVRIIAARSQGRSLERLREALTARTTIRCWCGRRRPAT